MVGLFLERIFLNFPRKSPVSSRSAVRLAIRSGMNPSCSVDEPSCSGSSMSGWRCANTVLQGLLFGSIGTVRVSIFPKLSGKPYRPCWYFHNSSS
ncbi:hypothetical protein AOLI_G00296570 [Acnodon oligacanthus]